MFRKVDSVCSLLYAAPTHAQQATAALCSPVQHGLSASCEAELHGMQQRLSSAAILQQAFIRQPGVKHVAAQSATAAGRRRQSSWPCQLAARRAQQQVLQLLAHRAPLQQEQALAARMERWAQRSGSEDMLMDSVRRKRKHKMNKVHANVHAASCNAWRPQIYPPRDATSCVMKHVVVAETGVSCYHSTSTASDGRRSGTRPDEEPAACVSTVQWDFCTFAPQTMKHHGVP
jgi:hypothetical protein